jgi:rRNA maturation protein Rpf1
VLLYLLDCAFNVFFCVKNTHTQRKYSTRTSCMRKQGPQHQRSRIQPSRVLTNCNSYKSKQCKGGINRTTEADLPQISSYANQTLLLLVGRTRRSIQQDGVKCAASKKKKRNVNTALFCFTKGLVLRNTIQLGTTTLTICSFFSTGLRCII